MHLKMVDINLSPPFYRMTLKLGPHSRLKLEHKTSLFVIEVEELLRTPKLLMFVKLQCHGTTQDGLARHRPQVTGIIQGRVSLNHQVVSCWGWNSTVTLHTNIKYHMQSRDLAWGLEYRSYQRGSHMTFILACIKYLQPTSGLPSPFAYLPKSQY